MHRNADDEVIPDITTTYYTRDQLLSYIQSDADLDVALNEAYAHAGRHFKNSALNAYFHSCSWYVDRGYADVELTGASKHNADLIAQIINDRGSSFKWMDIVLY